MEYPLSPLADAVRLLAAHAPRLLIVRGVGRTGEVRRIAYPLEESSGLWREDGQLIAAWHDEIARGLILDLLRESARPHNFPSWSRKALTPAGATECREKIPPAVLGMRERGEPPPAGLTECDAPDLNPLGYLGSPSGVVELATGRVLTPAEGRLKLVTNSLPDPFDPDVEHADVERLTAHLDAELADYLWDAFGYALHGKPARSFLLIIGEAGGGKTTLANAVTASLGPYAGALATGALTPDRSGHGARSATPDMESVMPPRRLAFGPEVEKMNPDTARLKALTGADLQAWRLLYQNLSQSEPTATLVLTGNRTPERLGLDDPAVVERVRAIPYPALPKADRDSRLLGAFSGGTAGSQRRRQALATKLVRHATSHESGMPPEPPHSVLAAIDAARDAELGAIGIWLRDHVRPGKPDDVLTTDALRDALTEALGATGDSTSWECDGLSWRKVTAKLRRMHAGLGNAEVVRGGKHSARGWRGWRLA